MFTNTSYNNFNKFRNKLLDYSRRFKIPFEDMEELVNDTILKALDIFDSERGNFESLCIVILKNKIFNFKRDNPYLYFLILIDENETVLEADEKSIEEKESLKVASDFLADLKSRLSEDEVRLFNEIYDMCETSNNVSISKASKNIGIEPLKGWDIFRKIQRKANPKANHKVKFAEYHHLHKAEDSSDLSVSENELEYMISEEQFPFPENAINKLNSLYNF